MAWPHCERLMVFLHKYLFIFIPLINPIFISLPTSASIVSPILSPTNLTASSDSVSCTAPVSISVWVLPSCSPPTLQTSAPPYLSVLVGGGWFCYLFPLMHLQLRRPAVSVRPGGGGVDTRTPSRTPDFSVSVCPGGEGWCCDQLPLAHPRILRGFRSALEIQLTPQIPTQMSSVGSPATGLRSSRHDFFCDRNTAAHPIQIEEKSLIKNALIVRRKERYIRPRVIVVSVTMLNKKMEFSNF